MRNKTPYDSHEREEIVEKLKVLVWRGLLPEVNRIRITFFLTITIGNLLGAMKMKKSKTGRLTLRPLVLLAALVLMGLGVRGAYWVVVDGMHGFASRTWTPVSATILTATLEESYGRGGREWTPNLTYSFSVDSKRSFGNNIKFPPRRGSRASAEETLKRYPVGQIVTAYYNPNDPAQSCLEPGPDWWFLFIIPFVTALLLACSVWLGIAALRGMTPNKRIQSDAGCRPRG